MSELSDDPRAKLMEERGKEGVTPAAPGAPGTRVWVLVSWFDDIDGVVSSERKARELGYEERNGQDNNSRGFFVPVVVDGPEEQPK